MSGTNTCEWLDYNFQRKKTHLVDTGRAVVIFMPVWRRPLSPTPSTLCDMPPLISWNEADGDDSDEIPDLVSDYPEVDFSPTM
jgi:hypothetical protein